MFADYFFRVALICLLAVGVVRPAAAVVESVAPTTAASYRAAHTFNGWIGGYYTSRGAACAAADAAYPSYSTKRAGVPPDLVCRYDQPTGTTWLTQSSLISSAVCPTATPAYTYNNQSGMCEREAPPCPAVGSDLSIGYYDVGDRPIDPLPLSFRTRCNNGCEVNYTGRGVTQGFRAQVSGTYHYFVVGEFNYTGETCVGGEFAPGAITSVPTASCNAGQTLVTGEGGFSKCYDDVSGTYVDGNSASAVAAVVAQGDAAYAAMMSDTAARMTAMGGTASDVVAAQTIAAGVYAAGGNSSGGTASGADPVMTAFCDQNPTASICADQDFGTVSDVTLGNQTVNVSITPVAVGGAGSCPVPSPMVLHGQTYYFVWDTYCQFASGIKPILLAFAWLAAAGILVGGFRS